MHNFFLEGFTYWVAISRQDQKGVHIEDFVLFFYFCIFLILAFYFFYLGFEFPF